MKIQLETDQLVIFESALYRTTCTLIIGSDYLLLIDPNWLPIEIEFVASYIDKLKLNSHQRYLLFTHSDYDHIIGYGRFRDWQTIASESFVSNKLKDKILTQIQDFDKQYYITRSYPVEYPAIDMVIREDEHKIIGTESIHFYQAPGHNADGLISFLPSQGILIAGDYLSNVEFPFIDFNYLHYVETLNRFKDLLYNEDIGVLIPGHGDYTSDPVEMRTRIKEAINYLGDLERHVLHGQPYDLQWLVHRYSYFSGMTKMHTNNIEMIRREHLDN